ncbi:MAG: arylsulfatase [Bryobacterales bacterium]|nr:arylsulfatase [Bryobacterales bacterium]
MRITRRAFLAGATAAAAQQRAGRPNIVVILADDLGYGDLGCYGQKHIRTPHIDKLAAEGMRFSQVYSGSTVCAPSRCVLMTGKHTGHSTVRGNHDPEIPIGRGEATIGTVLKGAGYRNAVFGKWGLGANQDEGTPLQRGYEEFFGYMNHWHAHQAFPDYLWEGRRESRLIDNWFHQRKVFAPDLFADRAIAFLERQSAAQPFFVYFASIIPHANNELGRFQPNGMEAPDQGIYAGEEWPDVEKNFAATITRLDSYVGRIVETLKAKGLDENTVVLFTSDNGSHKEGGHDPKFFASAGGLRGNKRDMYEGGIRVPAIVRWPARIRAGQVNDTPWAFWDLLPTFAELSGSKTPPGLDGVSLVGLWTASQPPRRDHFYWEFHERGFHQAVRQDEWKLVRQGPKYKLELFDLSKDASEANDVAAQHPDIVARLEKLLATARTESKDFPVKKQAYE